MQFKTPVNQNKNTQEFNRCENCLEIYTKNIATQHEFFAFVSPLKLKPQNNNKWINIS